MRLANFVRLIGFSLLAIFVVGGALTFLGVPTDVGMYNKKMEELDDFHRDNPVLSPEEIDEFFAMQAETPMPQQVGMLTLVRNSVLWRPWSALVAAGLVLLLVRPEKTDAVAAGAILCAVVFALIGIAPALYCVSAFVGYLLVRAASVPEHTGPSQDS